MKYKSYSSSKDNIDINYIFNFIYNFYKEIIFILIISFISGISFYSHKLSDRITEVKLEIEFRQPSPELFHAYSIFEFKIGKNNNLSLIDEYNKNFEQSFFSKDNLVFFLEQSRYLDSLKKSLGKSSGSLSEYFYNGRVGKVRTKDNINLNKIFLIYPYDFSGRDFLYDYVLFNKNKVLREFKNMLTVLIKNNILVHEEALEIANKINLLDPLILKSPNLQNIIAFESEPLFYKGATILRQEIVNKEKLLKKLEDAKFEYNVILDKNSVPINLNSSINEIFNFFIGLLFGFLSSSLIIFFKTLLKKNN